MLYNPGMTAKEALREMIDVLTEEEAERLVVHAEAEVAARPGRRNPTRPTGAAKRGGTRMPYSGPTALDLFNDIQVLFAGVPKEEWGSGPYAKDVDEVLYGELSHKRRSPDSRP